MFDIVIRLDAEYFLAAIDTTACTYITSEDTACFQTVDKLARKHIGLLNNPVVVYRLEERAYTLKYIEGFNTNESKPRLIIDASLLMWAAKPDYLEGVIAEAIIASDGYELSPELIAVIGDLITDIESRSDYWGEHHKPKYPLDNCRLGELKVDKSIQDIDSAFITSGIRESLSIMRNPYNLVNFQLAETQEIVRAYSDKLDASDFMFSQLNIATTNEFSDEEDYEGAGEEYRISPSQIMPQLSETIQFKYYVSELITDQSLLNIAKDAVDSVHYKQNIRTLNPSIRANNECLQYIVGSETIAEELNPNEKNMIAALQVLMIDLLMYEVGKYNTTEIDKLKESRSKMFDEYMLDILKRVMIENYSYTGKASTTFADEVNNDSDEGSDVDSFGLFGYNKTVCEDGQFRNYISPDEWLKIKDTINPDGPQRINKYLSSVVNRYAYAEMLIYMLRFGQTKSRYIKVNSKSDLSKPYFDTLKFEQLTQPIITGKFTYAKTEHGKDYYIEGSVYLNRKFEELSDNPITLPVAVVLKRNMVSGTMVKEEKLIIDINSFCAVVFTPLNGMLPYEIEGIDLVQGKPVVDLQYLRETANKVYCINEAVAMLNSDEVTCITAASARIIRAMNKYKLDAGVSSNEVLVIYDAYANLEDFKYSYAEIKEDFTPSDCTSKKDYVYKKILKDLTGPLFNSTLSSQFKKVNVIDILEEKQLSSQNLQGDKSSETLSFTTLLRYRQKSCKIIRADDLIVGYLFSSEYEGKKYMLIASTEDIGLSLPVTDDWFKYPYEKIIEGIIKPYQQSANKAKFIIDRADKGMYFNTDQTINSLSRFLDK